MAGISTTLSFRDRIGRIGRVRYFVAQGTPANEFTQAGAIATAIESLTSGQLAAAHGAYNIPPAAVIYGGGGTFETVEDKAVLTFQTAAGSIHRLSVPAPLSTIFLGDGQSVDPTNAAVVALVGAMLGIASDAAGNPLTTYVSGTRTRRKLIRKINVFSLSPTLGPDE